MRCKTRLMSSQKHLKKDPLSSSRLTPCSETLLQLKVLSSMQIILFYAGLEEISENSTLISCRQTPEMILNASVPWRLEVTRKVKVRTSVEVRVKKI